MIVQVKSRIGLLLLTATNGFDNLRGSRLQSQSELFHVS